MAVEVDAGGWPPGIGGVGWCETASFGGGGSGGASLAEVAETFLDLL